MDLFFCADFDSGKIWTSFFALVLIQERYGPHFCAGFDLRKL